MTNEYFFKAKLTSLRIEAEALSKLGFIVSLILLGHICIRQQVL